MGRAAGENDTPAGIGVVVCGGGIDSGGGAHEPFPEGSGDVAEELATEIELRDAM